MGFDNVIRVYPEDFFCDIKRCYTHNSDIVFYKDDNYLSYEDAKILISNVFEKIREAAAK